ncbi:MAG: hypothetical protein Q8936_05925 [Bacillota bacterium]|nr:hypothetical protein [Bacillota bacterium]
MYVFYILVIIGLVLVWLFLAKFFVKIGRAVDKTTKPFNENLIDEDREEGNKNE